jgi:hypothetical protein
MERVIKFNAWIPKLGLMLEAVTVYPDGMMGIGYEEFEDALKKQKGGRYEVAADEVYYKGEKDEDDIYERILTLLPGEDWFWIEKGDFIPLQFTGMEDGFKEELIEADIIKITPDEKEVVESDKETGYIFYDKKKGRFSFRDEWNEIYGIQSGDPSNKKIGNIYQNPDLVPKHENIKL